MIWKAPVLFTKTYRNIKFFCVSIEYFDSADNDFDRILQCDKNYKMAVQTSQVLAGSRRAVAFIRMGSCVPSGVPLTLT